MHLRKNGLEARIFTTISTIGTPIDATAEEIAIETFFPVDEATRFYNRTRAQYPNAKIGLLFGPNSGHMRGMSKSDVTAYQQNLENAWVDYYLKDEGNEPTGNVRAMLQTCPANAPAGDAFVAKDWASISPGEIRLLSPNAQTVSADGGDPLVGHGLRPRLVRQGADHPA